MASTSRDEVIRFIAQVSGEADLDVLAARLDALGKAADGANPEAQALANELQELANTAKNVDAYQTQQEALAKTSQSLQDAKAGQAALSAEFNRGDTSSAALTAAFATADKAVSDLTIKQNIQRAALADTSNALKNAGVDVTNLAAAHVQLAARAEEASAELVSIVGSGVTLGSAFESVKGFAERAGEGLKGAGEQALELGKKFIEITGIAALISTALAALTGERIFGEGIKDAAAFEQSIVKAGLATNATAEQLNELGEAADAAAEQTHSSADDAAAALAILAKGAGGAENAIAELVPTLLLSKAAQIDAATAADILGTAIAEFGLKAEDAGSVTDLLAKTATVAKTDLSDLSAGFAKVAPDAKAAGVSIEQTATFFAALSDNGIRGRKATQDLSSVFQEFANPASKLNEDLLGLGLSGKSLNQVLVALSGNSDATARIVQDLGAKGGSAFRALISAVPGMQQVNQQLSNSAGAAQDAADKFGNTLTGAFARFKTAFGDAAEALTKPLLEPLAKQFNIAATAITDFTKTADFGKIRDSILDFVSGAVAAITNFVKSFDFTSAAASISGFIKTSGEYFKSFTDGVNGIARVASGIGSTIGLVFNGLTTVIAGTLTVVTRGIQVALTGAAQLAKISGALPSEISAIQNQATLFGQTADDIDKQTKASYDAAVQNIANIGTAITGSGNATVAAGEQTKSFTQRVLEAAAGVKQQTDAHKALTEATIPTVTALHQATDAEIQHSDAAVKAAASTKLLQTAFETLGVTSQTKLQQAADNAKAAFDVIDKGSANTAAGLADRQQAFLAYAKAALAADSLLSDGQRDAQKAQLEGQAAILGTTNALKGLEAASDSARSAIVDDVEKETDALIDQNRRLAASYVEVADAANDTTRQIAEIAANSAKDFDASKDHIQGFTTSFSGLSQAAIDAYQNAQKAAITLVTGMTAFAEQYAQIQDEANRRTNASIASQQAGVKNLTDLYNGFAASANNADGQTAETLQRRADAMAKFSEQLKNGTSDFNYLDQSSLSALEASVDAAKAKVQQLADAAKAAAQQFADLAQQTQDALDQASGNQTAIEDRRHAKALADLQAEAKAAGELNSATYQQAVANENALFQLNLKNIKSTSDAQTAANTKTAQQQTTAATQANQAATASGGSGAVTGGIPVRVVQHNFATGSQNVSAFVSVDESDAFEAFIAKLAAAQRNSI